MFRAIGAFVSRYPRRVLLFWALLIALCLPLAGRVGEVLTTDAGIAPGSEAQEIRRTLLREFAGNNNHQLLIVADADPEAPPSSASFSASASRRPLRRSPRSPLSPTS